MMAILDKILIGSLLLALAVSGILYYKLGAANDSIETLSAANATLKLTVENQQIFIQSLELTNQLTRDVIAMREKEMKQLEEEMLAIGEDLGEGDDELAPATTRELIRRLQSR